MSRVVVFVDPTKRGWKGEVDYQSDLPDPSLHTGEVWLVKNDSGILPFKKKAGFYRSTGGTWKYLGVSTLGSLTDVDISSITDGQGIVYSGGGFVPETLALSSHNHDNVYLKQDGTTFVSSNWDVDGQGTLFIDRVNNRVGINKMPNFTFDVSGDVKADRYLMGNQFSWHQSALASNVRIDLRPLMFGQWADAFQFAQIISVEYFDDVSQSWVTWSGANMAPLFDGNPNTKVTIDYTHRKFRITIYTREWLQLGVVHIYREWSSGGTKAYTLNVERSADGATFTQVASASFDALQYFDNLSVYGHYLDRYWRLTFDISFANTTDTMPFVWIRGFTARLSYGTYFGLPITWDYNKNIGVDISTPTAKLDVNGDIKAVGGTFTDTVNVIPNSSNIGLYVYGTNNPKIKIEDTDGGYPGLLFANAGVIYGRFEIDSFGSLTFKADSQNINFLAPNGAMVFQTGVTVASAYNDGTFRIDYRISVLESTPPAAPSANEVYIYAADDGAGLTELRAVFNTGDHLVLGVQGLTVPTYTLSNVTVTRTLDPTTATLSDVANVLATLIQDLQARRLIKPYI